MELLFRVSRFLQGLLFIFFLKACCLFLCVYPPLLRLFMEMGERQSGVRNSRVKIDDVMWSFLTLRATAEQIHQYWVEAWHKKATVGKPAPNPTVFEYKTEQARRLLDAGLSSAASVTSSVSGSRSTSRPLVLTFGSCS